MSDKTNKNPFFYTLAKLRNVDPHHIMDWFYYSVTEACGDGSAVICCGNPKETSDYFIEWWKAKHLPEMKWAGYQKDEFYHPIEEYAGQNGELIVNYHDSNENFMFCDKVIDLGFGDVSFIVESDCKTLDGKFTCLEVTSCDLQSPHLELSGNTG
jgi:hypothetical protein